MSRATPTVFIVDDDAPMRDSLRSLLDSFGMASRGFAHPDEFLRTHSNDHAGCLLLDIRMPDMSGLMLQEELERCGLDVPVVFITGHADVPMAVTAMRQGAIGFIEKPFRPYELIGSLREALERDDQRRRRWESEQALRARIASLSAREGEVLQLVVEGRTNRDIAAALDISPRSVEAHRARVMTKLQAGSFAELIRIQMIVERLS